MSSKNKPRRNRTRYHITAIIYDKRGRVLSIGQNSYIKTHPHMKRVAEKSGYPDKIFIHAEVDAIVKCRDLSRAHRIFVARFDKNKNPMLAKPCECCMTAIREAGIEHIDYTVSTTDQQHHHEEF